MSNAGRPRKGYDTIPVNARLSQRAKDALDDNAKRAGLSKTDYLEGLLTSDDSKERVARVNLIRGQIRYLQDSLDSLAKACEEFL